MKLRDFIGLLDYDSMIGTDPMDMYIAILSPSEDGDIGLSYADVIRKIPGVLLNGEIDSIILPTSEDETLTITVDGVVYPTSSGMNPSSDEVEDFFTGASSEAKGRYVRASSDVVTLDQLVSKLDEFYDQSGMIFEEMYNGGWWDYELPFSYDDVKTMLTDFVYNGEYFDLGGESDVTPDEFVDSMLAFIFK